MRTKIKTNYSQYLQTSKRVDGKIYVKCVEGTPEKLREFIRSLHMNEFDCLPNDWVYQVIMEALEQLEGNDNDIDDCSFEADCYYSELQKWLGEPYAHGFCNEVMEFFDNSKDIYKVIGQGQYLAKRRIYEAVSEFLSEQNTEEEEQI